MNCKQPAEVSYVHITGTLRAAPCREHQEAHDSFMEDRVCVFSRTKRKFISIILCFYENTIKQQCISQWPIVAGGKAETVD